MAAIRFALDSSYRRPRRGRTVIGGSPLRLFTLSEAGVRAMAAIEDGDEPPTGHQGLTDRLIDAGALHPEPTERDDAEAWRSLTIVIPARDQWPHFRPHRCRTIVVDDASHRPLGPAAAAPTVEVIR